MISLLAAHEPKLSITRALSSLLLWSVVSSAGCDVFDSERHPYTPFAVASGAATQTPEPAAALPLAAEPAARSRESLTAPPRAPSWQLEGRELRAPEGMFFRLALVGGPDPGQEHDVLAWLVGTPEQPSIGELWLYPESGSARRVAAAPGFLPTGASCTHAVGLRWTGQSSVALDIKAACDAPLLPRAPERSVTVLSPWRSQPKIVGFQLAAPAPGERLEVDLVSEDRDHDGRDDVEMTLRLTSPDGNEARARLVWLDRTAGLSRDTTEPLASFRELAALEKVRASNHKSSVEVASHVASVRRLYASLCSNAGSARIFMEDGGGLDCGPLAEPFQALTEAEVQAALNVGGVAQAFAALEQRTWFPATTGVESERFISRQLSQLTQRVTRRRVIKLVPLKAQPRALSDAPHLSPLSFHADGSLLLLTSEGLVRAAPDGRFEYDASSEIDAWNTELVSPSGERLVGVAYPCDRSEVSWLRSAADGTPLAPLATSLIAPRPGRCGPASGFDTPPLRPAAWGSEGISAFIGASLIGDAPTHPPLGSAFSPNGRHGMTTTPWGLLVTGADKAALWVFENAGLGSQLRDCVVSNNAQAAACVLAGRAYVILPDPKTG